MRGRALFVVFFALCHAAATVFAGASALGAVMYGFDNPAAAGSAGERFYMFLATILTFPLIRSGGFSAPGLWGYLVFVANGFLWAIALLGCWDGVRWFRRRRLPDPRAGA